jgi:hypothetical protein
MRSWVFILLKLEPAANLPGSAAARKVIAAIEDFALSGSRIRPIVNVGQLSIAGPTRRLLNVAQAAALVIARTSRNIDINLLESTGLQSFIAVTGRQATGPLAASCGPA